MVACTIRGPCVHVRQAVTAPGPRDMSWQKHSTCTALLLLYHRKKNDHVYRVRVLEVRTSFVLCVRACRPIRARERKGIEFITRTQKLLPALSHGAGDSRVGERFSSCTAVHTTRCGHGRVRAVLHVAMTNLPVSTWCCASRAFHLARFRAHQRRGDVIRRQPPVMDMIVRLFQCQASLFAYRSLVRASFKFFLHCVLICALCAVYVMYVHTLRPYVDFYHSHLPSRYI
jgi:hypothetical protein